MKDEVLKVFDDGLRNKLPINYFLLRDIEFYKEERSSIKSKNHNANIYYVGYLGRSTTNYY